MFVRLIPLLLISLVVLGVDAYACPQGGGAGWSDHRGGGGWQHRGGGWSHNRGGWARHRGRGHSLWQIPDTESSRLNPTPVSEESLRNGKAIYQASCLRCHGVGGFGDGPDATGLKVRPAVLRRAAHHYNDGELAWIIRTGRDPMPAWEGLLTEEQIWDLVNYLRFEIGGRHGHRQAGRGGHRRWCENDSGNCPQSEPYREQDNGGDYLEDEEAEPFE